MTATSRAAVVLHVITVPISLRFFTGQALYLKGQGFHVQVVTSPGEELTAFTDRDSVRGYAVPMSRSITPFADLLSLLRLVRLIAEVKPDIVHSHTAKAGLLGMLAALAAPKSVCIYQLRGLRYSQSVGWRRVVLQGMDRLACRIAHRVLCVSASIREQAIQDGLCHPTKIAVLANGSGQGVDARTRLNPDLLALDTRARTRERLQIAPDAFVLGFVGRSPERRSPDGRPVRSRGPGSRRGGSVSARRTECVHGWHDRRYAVLLRGNGPRGSAHVP